MITPDNRHYRQVQLLVRVLPHVAEEPCFALKGGTAISLFIREPRWELLGLAGVDRLPAVKWKLHNLAKMTPGARQHALARLERVLS